MSEIIFWRHAEAHEATEGQDDLDRKLTVKGQRQAERVAFWLDRNLPQQCRVFASPATRSQQTVSCLSRKSKMLNELNPGARPDMVSVTARCRSTVRAASNVSSRVGAINTSISLSRSYVSTLARALSARPESSSCMNRAFRPRRPPRALIASK